MKKFGLFVALIAVLFFVTNAAEAAGKESAYDRVMRTKTLRCGYIVWGDVLRKDPNTGEFSGFTYDMVNAIANELKLKVDWVEETGWGTFSEGLNAGRFDMMCGILWASGDRAKAAFLTKPVSFNAMYAVAREDDGRFDGKDAEGIDTPGVTVAVVEGDPSQDIWARLFPKSKELALSPMTDTASYLLAVATGKADVGLMDMNVVTEYNAKNPEKRLKALLDGKPVKRIPNVYAVKFGEDKLKYLIDSAIDIVNASGEAAMICDHYGVEFYTPVAPAYGNAEISSKGKAPANSGR